MAHRLKGNEAQRMSVPHKLFGNCPGAFACTVMNYRSQWLRRLLASGRGGI